MTLRGASAAGTARWAARTVASPVGPLLLLADEKVVAGIHFRDPDGRESPEGTSPEGQRELLDRLARWLDGYWGGSRVPFDLPRAALGTPWQRAVWDYLLTIPWGTLVSYGDLAVAVGTPGGARAVGRAVGSNPWAIAVPCHRVVGRHGLLTGYGGGLDKKEWLLRHEGALLV